MCDLLSVFNLLTEIVAQVGAPLILAHTSFRDLLILSRSRNNLSSMKYRRDLENGNNSQQLLEAINQGICDSLERQLDYAHAPTIAGHLNPGPAQQYPKVDDEQCQPDQQQSQGRIARTSAGPHLM